MNYRQRVWLRRAADNLKILGRHITLLAGFKPDTDDRATRPRWILPVFGTARAVVRAHDPVARERWRLYPDLGVMYYRT